MSKKSETKKEIILLSCFFIFIFSLFFITKDIANEKKDKKTIAQSSEQQIIPIVSIVKDKKNEDEYIIQTKNKYYFIKTKDNLDVKNYLNISFINENENNQKICLKNKCYSFIDTVL